MLTESDARGAYSRQYVPPFRVGIVTAQQISPFPAARVQFPDRDNIVTYWLPICLPKVQDDKFFWMPDVGEQVLVLMDEHDENGAVVGSLGSTVDQAPGWATANTFGVQFSDGTVVRYDRAAHALTAALGSGGSATISTPLGNQVVLDNAGNVGLTAGPGGKVTFSNGSAPNDALALVSKLVAAFNAHIHPDPQGGDTGVPTVQWTASTVESITTAVTD